MTSLSNKTYISYAIVSIILLAGCKATSPALTGPARRPAPIQYATPKPDPRNFESQFSFSASEFTAKQANYNANEITALFQVSKDGRSVNGLAAGDFNVQENGTPIPKFQLSADTQRLDQVADIAFVVDITGSMGPFIESAKLRLKNFIVTSRQAGYHVRMCLSTFGDFVVRKCDRFFDNTSDQQVKEFISELTQISIKRHQGEIEPYIDMEENPMRALVEATSAQWLQSSQRFVILVTDADFYSPDKPNRMLQNHMSIPETAAPTMAEVTQAIKDSSVRVFAITPSTTGYDQPLAGQPGITQSSSGEHFLFKQVVAGRISIDSILDRILRLISTTYKITYLVDQVPGLDPTLNVANRKITISTSSGQASLKSVSSSMPSGRPQYQQTWNVSTQPIQAGSMQVFVDDRLISANEYTVNGTQVTFKDVPKAGSSLRFVYFYDAIEKNLRLAPMTIQAAADARATKVYLNGREARSEDIRFDRTMDGQTNISLAESAMASNDPYDIRRNRGVQIRVITNFAN